MSTGLELIPLALMAIGAAVSQARKPTIEQPSSTPTYALQTRMRDAHLLAAAIMDHSADAAWHQDVLVATVNGVPMNLVLPQSTGLVEAVVPQHVPPDHAQDALTRLDDTYGRHVQQAVRMRVLQEAEGSGMQVESEHVEPDHSIVLTLRVSASA